MDILQYHTIGATYTFGNKCVNSFLNVMKNKEIPLMLAKQIRHCEIFENACFKSHQGPVIESAHNSLRRSSFKL